MIEIVGIRPALRKTSVSGVYMILDIIIYLPTVSIQHSFNHYFYVDPLLPHAGKLSGDNTA